MTPRIRLLHLAACVAAANLALVVVAAGLTSNAHATAAAHRLLALCGLAP